MRKILLVVLAMMVLLCCWGCSHRGYWTKPNIQPEQFKKDVYECRLDAEFATYKLTGDAAIFTPIARSKWFNRCMESRGYEWRRGRPEKPIVAK